MSAIDVTDNCHDDTVDGSVQGESESCSVYPHSVRERKGVVNKICR
ncbi:hypothetical protein E2C01_101411 [Portunus trituberculatus]|uniref:Uncharacterized protein n=1 Tax=Portunus trituberculatus TaxID=210409 RepID=A0A5B7KLX3_PORTR|nr:hypothetical protein [Portunus trituberculatus]